MKRKTIGFISIMLGVAGWLFPVSLRAQDSASDNATPSAQITDDASKDTSDLSVDPTTHKRKKSGWGPTPSSEPFKVYPGADEWAKGNGALNSEDYPSAIKWFKKAAALDTDGSGEASLGNIYLFGKGVPKDEVKADYWYQKAAEKDNYDAQVVLRSKNKKMRRDAEAGKPDAQYNFAMYCLADNLKTEAFPFMKGAAEQGNAAAQYQLGILYSDGDATPKNLDLAEAWESKAAENGYEGAQTMLDDFRDENRAAHPSESADSSQSTSETTTTSSDNSSSGYDQNAADEAARKERADEENRENRQKAGMDP